MEGQAGWEPGNALPPQPLYDFHEIRALRHPTRLASEAANQKGADARMTWNAHYLGVNRMSNVNRAARSRIERLEPRRLLSSTMPNVDIGPMTGNQAEGSIAVDPIDPSRLVAITNIDFGDGLMIATSADGGATWTHRTMADDKDGLPPACCDPSLAFDPYGNLFAAYLNSSDDQVIVLLSSDEGQSFSLLTKYNGKVDQPTITTGPGAAWLTFADGSNIVAAGASDTGLNQVGSFSAVKNIPGSSNGNFGDIAIGPAGQVMLTYQRQVSASLSKIFVNVDSDGLGPGKFGKAIEVTTTHVADFDYIDAQSQRAVDAEAGLAFDRSGGAFNGRVYMVYTDEFPTFSGNTDVFLRYSDNGGSVWSNPIRLNDDTSLNSQFLPRIAVDQSSGLVAASWYDCRNDAGGAVSAGNTNDDPNDDAEYFATLVTPETDGVIVSANQQISAGASNAEDANNSIDLGDYTGLNFFDGTLHPLWFDNSNSTGDNPDGTLKDLDAYSANVPADAFTVGSTLSLGGLTDPVGPVAALSLSGNANVGYIKKGKAYTVTVTYTDPNGVSPASVGNTNLMIAGPHGFSATARLLKAKPRKGGSVLATYSVAKPTGDWTAADAGVYTILLEPNQILDGRSRPSTGGILGTFTVATGGTGSHAGGTGPRHHGGDPDAH
jgi:hypothetical protein